MDQENINTKVCPYCAETIEVAATVCRFCNHTLPSDGEPSQNEIAPRKTSTVTRLYKELHPEYSRYSNPDQSALNLGQLGAGIFAIIFIVIAALAALVIVVQMLYVKYFGH